ncbi:MAG: DNA repair protein RecO [Lentilactobacillus buchneri]|uniref:DNA repair protein RecO n=2 Tax=Lentilactobacillus hilgardii TaxID=1588 RepID=A0A6P1E618_LENHI|nr:DNA repair protein RecO [Lentilactobacillus hilgardii]MCI1922899.1 DNA repair protein RecO [Lentilactobacillus buchneri]RRG11429.1 MAG: DNA repair protein RecO [Lactobacillus sp.]EEI70008.1 DNA repair protein RecO [Lentilactobacillus hilgardii ATCC 27305]MCI1950107.1 DNA repair protein RecO [Lentilactobacillus buchneri]MCI2019285.1 DNA repair protein RecO [Lentilactobacillus buchneri]
MNFLVKAKPAEFHGILLYTKAYRERDLLIKFLTREFGKKMFLVHGAKRPKFRMRAAILPFTYGAYFGDLKDDGLSYINNYKRIDHFQGITADITKNAYATYIMSLIDLAFQDSIAIPKWYDQLMIGLSLIDDGFDEEIITNIFEIQLLSAFGVEPDWVDCAICHRRDLPFDYSEAYGGLLCQNHFDKDPYRLHLDQRTIYFLRLFSIVDLTKLKTIQMSDKTKKSLRKVIDQIYTNSVGVVPKSKRFIDQLGKFKI